MATQDKLDLLKLHRDEYAARQTPTLVEVGTARYLAVDGYGAPGGDRFQGAVGALYAAAYTIKMTSKAAGRDYVVGKLEGVWWSDGDDPSLAAAPPETWRWRLMIRTPEFITDAELIAAARRIAARQPETHIGDVRLVDLDEGRCVQMLHVGPYQNEGETVAVMRSFAEAQGLRLAGPHHEVYLSDPRRVEPERLRTIVRYPIAEARG